ncbi:hypothetical protein CARUB_v10021169mg [Capsella rubella]|uniref:K-box domain-containing protein n=1 Tax=Capsella rubella TaxID=81985 RepID=R0GJH0_9BRAS|nr:hypothetical protein CARUB_v10021169mg [Capsella rubella]
MGREKKMRVLCNFCECSGSRFELRPHGQYEGALSSVERELSRLRLLTRKMTGKDLDGLNFAELLLLESQLKDALLIVQNQKVMNEDNLLLCTLYPENLAILKLPVFAIAKGSKAARR